MNACTLRVFSQVLVQFAGVVLVKDESESGCEEPRQEERVAEETTEEEEKKNEEDTKTEVEMAVKEDCE